jgi:hypothetical protein
MSRTRQQAISDAIAARIMKNSHKRFSSLHEEALGDIMSTPVNEQSGSPRDSRNGAINSGLSVGSQVTVGPIKPVDSKTLSGSYPGDHREKESEDFSTESFKNQAGPRGETGTKAA